MESEAWLWARLWYRALGIGLGVAALYVTAYALLFGPFIIYEYNATVRYAELAAICAGIVALLSQLVRKR